MQLKCITGVCSRPLLSKSATFLTSQGTTGHFSFGNAETVTEERNRHMIQNFSCQKCGCRIIHPTRATMEILKYAFLRGYLKGRVHTNKPKTIEQLKENIGNKMCIQLQSLTLPEKTSNDSRIKENLKKIAQTFLGGENVGTIFLNEYGIWHNHWKSAAQKPATEIDAHDNCDHQYLCAVCESTVQAEDLKKAACGDVFHAFCLSEWRKHSRKCPECRARI
nr:unnamed protein product [Callosobruchus chinensis]